MDIRLDRKPELQPAPGTAGVAAHIPSESLFGGRREVVILHKGREYRLRLTQNDKLILTA
jgi:hemin uptake protein HemP